MNKFTLALLPMLCGCILPDIEVNTPDPSTVTTDTGEVGDSGGLIETGILVDTEDTEDTEDTQDTNDTQDTQDTQPNDGMSDIGLRECVKSILVRRKFSVEDGDVEMQFP